MSDFRIKNGVLKKYTGSAADVVIPDGVTAIGDGAFAVSTPWKSRLKSVVIPEGVTSVGDKAFYNCDKLESITLPESLTEFGSCPFRRCKALADRRGMLILRNILFEYTGRSRTVVIPDGVTAIGDRAFSYYSTLMNVTVPESVTSIGEWAFYWCNNLQSITIPETVTVLGKEAFYGCVGLKSITLPSRFGRRLNKILGTVCDLAIHIEDIAHVEEKYRPGCAVGFAEDGRSIRDENGRRYARYIKANAPQLIGKAMEHPALFYLMVHEKLIDAKDVEAVTAAVQESGNMEFIAEMLEYADSAVSAEEKEALRIAREEREEHIVNFLFDSEKLDAIEGKTLAVCGKLKTFASRDEFRACLEAAGAALAEKPCEGAQYLITNSPHTRAAQKAGTLGIPCISENEFNEMIGRTREEGSKL